MLERLMVKEDELKKGDYPPEIVRYAESGPAGDYLALVSSVAAGIVCFAHFFNGWLGYQTAYGLAMLAVCAAIAAFSGMLVAARFLFQRVPGLRSPAWAYYAGGFALVVLTVMALVFGWRDAAPTAVLFFPFLSGAVLFVAGMVSG
ncbi:MAG: hypothetical protein QME88_03435 [Actinomycetota bacterium]|nr:hypothetical protein [Actinomycetota bacterium]